MQKLILSLLTMVVLVGLSFDEPSQFDKIWKYVEDKSWLLSGLYMTSRNFVTPSKQFGDPKLRHLGRSLTKSSSKTVAERLHSIKSIKLKCQSSTRSRTPNQKCPRLRQTPPSWKRLKVQNVSNLEFVTRVHQFECGKARLTAREVHKTFQNWWEWSNIHDHGGSP